MSWIKEMGSSYLGFAIGTIFGAVIATLTSYYIFEAALGSPDAANILQIQDCLRENVYG